MAPSITRNSEPTTTNGAVQKPREPPSDLLYKISSLPGKGKALLATYPITPGTLILSEAPILTTECITIENIELCLAIYLKTLPKASQRAFLSLHNNYPGQKSPLSNIIRSNGYPLGPNSEVGGIFATISRINHSCLPNAVHSWNPTKGEETVYAVRPIAEDEEITLSYHSGGPSSTRQELLRENFGFDCTCELCSLPAAELKKSDARLIRAQALDATIGDSGTVTRNPEKVLRNCKSLKEIFDQEGVKDDRLARLWYDAFQVVGRHGDEARMKIFAERYCDVKRISQGEDGVDYLEMTEFVESPSRHECFEKGGKWESRARDVPRGLREEEFEKWLWRV